MPLRNIPIKRKITFVIMVTCFTALAANCVALLTYEIHSFKQSTARTMDTMAEIVASNSTPALAFNIKTDGQQVLDGLRAEPSIVGAALYDQSGLLFVTYPASRDRATFPQSPKADGLTFGNGGLSIFRPAIEGNRRVGTFFLEADFSEMYNRLGIYGLILLGMLAASGALAYAISTVLQRQISLPLINLANTAKIVSEQRDYSVRAEKRGNDEIGDLTSAFNSMLDRIQSGHLALRESEARLSAVFMQAGVGIAQNGLDGRFLLVNDRFCEIFGRARPELLRLRMADILEPADWIHHGSAARESAPLGFETSYRRPDGQNIWLRSRVAPIKSSQGVVESTICVTEDITARKEALEEIERARDAAERASRAKDDFVAALSHELRTPLNPVLLLASDAASNKDLPPAVRGDFETIRKNVELEARLIDDLLDLTRITRGKITLERRPVEIGSVLRDAIETIRAEVEEKEIKLSVSNPAGNRLVTGDPVRIQQIFWNVLRNAVKFTPMGGAVSVSTSVPAAGDKVQVKVSDTGIGLTKMEIETIFDSFAQGDHARNPASHRFGGMGLGLAISRMLADLQSGTITAASLGRDRGASFTIEFPLAAAGGPAPAEGAAPGGEAANPTATKPVNAGGKRILLVDDHEPTRSALMQLLNARKYRVLAAGSVEEARQLAANNTFDLLVSDIGLPDGSGSDLMAELHVRYGLKGIALSGYGMEQDIARSREAGFVFHLTKPVTVKALEKAMAAMEETAKSEGGLPLKS